MVSVPLREPLTHYVPLVRAVVELFHPLVEGAIHDLRSGQLVALYNNLSKREIGEATPLCELGVTTDQFPDYFPPYLKRNWDGRELKSISITVRDSKEDAVGLICFNFDISLFSKMERFLGGWLQIAPESKNPIEQFTLGGEEKLHRLIEELIEERGWSLGTLKREQKGDIVRALHKKGAFLLRNGTAIAADTLQLSRATIYNIIKRANR